MPDLTPERLREMTFGQAIKFFRTEKNITIKDLAEQMAVHPSTIRRWERENTDLRIDKAFMLARLLDMNMHLHKIEGPRCPTDIDLVFPRRVRGGQ